jgi:hypothetical protein
MTKISRKKERKKGKKRKGHISSLNPKKDLPALLWTPSPFSPLSFPTPFVQQFCLLLVYVNIRFVLGKLLLVHVFAMTTPDLLANPDRVCSTDVFAPSRTSLLDAWHLCSHRNPIADLIFLSRR